MRRLKRALELGPWALLPSMLLQCTDRPVTCGSSTAGFDLRDAAEGCTAVPCLMLPCGKLGSTALSDFCYVGSRARLDAAQGNMRQHNRLKA